MINTRNTLYKYLGLFFVGVGFIGLFIPLMPTTPWLLIAAYLFSKSSRKWHDWLLSQRFFGPIIREWEEHHCITLTTKIMAVFCMLFFAGYSLIFIISNPYVRALGVVLLIIGLISVLRLKVCKREIHKKRAWPWGF